MKIKLYQYEIINVNSLYYIKDKMLIDFIKGIRNLILD